MSDFIWLNPFPAVPEETPRLEDVFEDWDDGGGIFYEMDQLYMMPWSEYLLPDFFGIDPTFLDILYFGTHSGSKLCSPIVKKFLSNGTLPDEKVMRLAQIIVAKFSINWQRLWETMVVEYNPLHNYDITETRELTAEKDESKVTDGSVHKTGTDSLQHGKTETASKSATETGSQSYGKIETTAHGKGFTDELEHGKIETIDHGKEVTDSLTHGKTDTTTHGKKVDDENYRYGFNSGVTPEPSDKETITESGTTKVETTGIDADVVTESGTTETTYTGTDTRTVSESGTTKVTDSGSDGTSLTKSGQETITSGGTDTQTKNLLDETDVTETLDQNVEESEETQRRGNIGVTTTQKLIQEERETWLWNYFEQVFNDIDTILALQIHDPCRV